MKQDTYYCNVCGAMLSGGKSDGENMWCSKCRGDKEKEENRNYTPDTVYLVCKWYAEGMDIKDIALMLKRSEENVRRALDIGSKDPSITAKYMRYLIPKPPGYHKRKASKGKPAPIYNVYDKMYKRYLIKGATAEECAKEMGVSVKVFHIRKRTSEQHSDWSRWFIYRVKEDDVDAQQDV